MHPTSDDIYRIRTCARRSLARACGCRAVVVAVPRIKSQGDCRTHCAFPHRSLSPVPTISHTLRNWFTLSLSILEALTYVFVHLPGFRGLHNILLTDADKRGSLGEKEAACVLSTADVRLVAHGLSVCMAARQHILVAVMVCMG
jgi:hypothetical protein